MCKKVRYRDELRAKMALADIQSKDRPYRGRTEKRAEKRAYRCPSCHGWHLTSRA